MFHSCCSHEIVKEHVRRYLASSIEHQKLVPDIVIRQFHDVFLDQCVNSITVYDLSAEIQVCTYTVKHLRCPWCSGFDLLAVTCLRALCGSADELLECTQWLLTGCCLMPADS